MHRMPLLIQLQHAIQHHYPDIRMNVTRIPDAACWELEIHVRRELLIVEWCEGGVFGIAVLNEHNQWDRRFTYYNDIEFQTYDETKAYLLQQIKNRISTARL
jgi:hypothetical protein